MFGQRLTNLLGCRHGIIQAPMAGASNPDLVAAVSSAGALGSLGAAAMPPDTLRKNIQAIRQQTDAPFNINLFNRTTEQFDTGAEAGPAFKRLLSGYHDEFNLGDLAKPRGLFGPMAEQLEVLIEEQVPVVSVHFGIEPDDVAKLKAAGCKVLCSATTVNEARILEHAGVDAIIAQGSEAGGHRGTFDSHYRDALVGTLALVPQLVDSVSVPVIAAGGIMDARGILACLVLGAEGVQMGTAFLACPETGLNDAWRQTLQTSEGHSTTVTTAISGKPARGIRNRYINEVEALDEALLPYPLQYSMSGKLRASATNTDNPDFMAMWAGQGVGLIQQKPAAQLIDEWLEGLGQLTSAFK